MGADRKAQIERHKRMAEIEAVAAIKRNREDYTLPASGPVILKPARIGSSTTRMTYVTSAVLAQTCFWALFLAGIWKRFDVVRFGCG
jgi:hypothetical protein